MCRRAKGYWRDEDNVRQELEVLAAEQQAENLIEFIEPGQALSPRPAKAGMPQIHIP